MEFEEWQEYVNIVAGCDYPIPPSFIQDYNDWHCRSIVGRMLLMLGNVEGAMRVLSTVRDVEVDMEHNPEYGLSDPEHKCLCYRDLGEIVWMLTQNADAALYYFEQAYAICKEYTYAFHSAKRGGIWARRLEIKRASGKLPEALDECLTKMDEQDKEDNINQYLFFGNKFLAECYAEKEDYAKACACLAEGFKYYPLSDAGKKDIAEVEGLADLKERYNGYLHCATLQYLPWEDFDVPTLEEVRDKQYERYLKRKAAEANGTVDKNEQTMRFNVEDYVEK